MAHTGRPIKCDPKIDNLRSEIRLENYEIAKATLKEFGIDSTDSDGRTALINAVIENKPNFINWLVDNGANINVQDRIGYSVLHFAGQEKLVEIAKYFLEKGANPNLHDVYGNNALWTAIFNSKLPTDEKGVIKLLLKFGTDPNNVNKTGKTPSFMYQTFNGTDIMTLTIE